MVPMHAQVSWVLDRMAPIHKRVKGWADGGQLVTIQMDEADVRALVQFVLENRYDPHDELEEVAAGLLAEPLFTGRIHSIQGVKFLTVTVETGGPSLEPGQVVEVYAVS